MHLFFFRAPEGNFGDDLNHWIWDDLLPGRQSVAPETHLIGVGTILTDSISYPPGRKLVLGSGCGYGNLPKLDDSFDVRAVRGPLTAKRLGLRSEKAICDAAMLLPTLKRFSESPIKKSDGIVFVPHYKSLGLVDWEAVCHSVGVVYQSPSDDAEGVIRKIAGADRVIAESLHAAIIADAFGVPWKAVSIGGGFNTFKWSDWSASLNMGEVDIFPFFNSVRQIREIVKLFKGKALVSDKGATSDAKKIAPLQIQHGSKGHWLLSRLALRNLKVCKDGVFNLSDRGVLSDRQHTFLTMLASVRKDYDFNDNP